MLREFQGKTPSIAADAYVADGAILIGGVTLKEGSSVWFNSVLRADSEPITIGRFTNVQDNSTLHVDPGFPCVVGDHVTIGHGAIVHACTVEDNVLIGMHATVLSGAIVGRDSIVGANALVTENARIPPGSLVLGVPGKVVRSLKPEEIEGIRRSAEGYVRRAAQYRVGSPDSDGCA
jgi:carbonic anhydrase/acetyltransferase-like protein (isoleucine patch superfamily)